VIIAGGGGYDGYKGRKQYNNGAKMGIGPEMREGELGFYVLGGIF